MGFLTYFLTTNILEIKDREMIDDHLIDIIHILQMRKMRFREISKKLSKS